MLLYSLSLLGDYSPKLLLEKFQLLFLLLKLAFVSLFLDFLVKLFLLHLLDLFALQINFFEDFVSFVSYKIYDVYELFFFLIKLLV